MNMLYRFMTKINLVNLIKYQQIHISVVAVLHLNATVMLLTCIKKAHTSLQVQNNYSGQFFFYTITV